jgi:hypothetical protein
VCSSGLGRVAGAIDQGVSAQCSTIHTTRFVCLAMIVGGAILVVVGIGRLATGNDDFLAGIFQRQAPRQVGAPSLPREMLTDSSLRSLDWDSPTFTINEEPLLRSGEREEYTFVANAAHAVETDPDGGRKEFFRSTNVRVHATNQRLVWHSREVHSGAHIRYDWVISLTLDASVDPYATLTVSGFEVDPSDGRRSFLRIFFEVPKESADQLAEKLRILVSDHQRRTIQSILGAIEPAWLPGEFGWQEGVRRAGFPLGMPYGSHAVASSPADAQENLLSYKMGPPANWL